MTLKYLVKIGVKEIKAVKNISNQYSCDRVFLLGFSQGAAYTYITGIKNPDLFEGIICIGGVLPYPKKSFSLLTRKDKVNGNNLRIFIANGKQDQSYREGVKAKDLLEKYGYDVTFF